MMPILSILVPSISQRMLTRLPMLFFKLLHQAAQHNVEVLALIDNQKRSIGEKRNALLDIARGSFIAFVDDDDDVAPDYVAEIVAAATANPDADVIVFNQRAIISGADGIIKFGIEYENTEFSADRGGATRKPFHVCAYAARIAKRCRFADSNWGEDLHWCEQAWPLIRNQVRIDQTLHTYCFRPAISQATPAVV